MIYNPTGNNFAKHNKHQPHFSAKISLVSRAEITNNARNY